MNSSTNRKKRTVIIKPSLDVQNAIRNVSASILSSAQGKVLFVEGWLDKDLYEKIAISLNKTIHIVKLNAGQYLTPSDYTFTVGHNGQSSTKRTIIILVKRLYATELLYPAWYKKKGNKEVYGIVDRDFDYSDNDIKTVGNQISPGDNVEKVIKFIGNGVKINNNYPININSRLCSTHDACDAESLIFCFDKQAIEKVCPSSKSLDEWKKLIKNTEKKSTVLGFVKQKSEIKKVFLKLDDFFKDDLDAYYNFIDSTNACMGIEDCLCRYYVSKSNWENIIKSVQTWTKGVPSKTDWNYCKGHDLENILTDKMNNIQVSTNYSLLNHALMRGACGLVNVLNFQKSAVYQFIAQI